MYLVRTGVWASEQEWDRSTLEGTFLDRTEGKEYRRAVQEACERRNDGKANRSSKKVCHPSEEEVTTMDPWIAWEAPASITSAMWEGAENLVWVSEVRGVSVGEDTAEED